MSTPKVLFGFHAVGVRLKTAPASIIEVYVDPTRRDARMKQFLSRAAEAGLRQAVHEARAERWRQENAEALAASNAWVDEKGLPLAAYRPF